MTTDVRIRSTDTPSIDTPSIDTPSTDTPSTDAPPPDAPIGLRSIVTYRSLRRGLMIIAFLLPWVLWVWGLVRSSTLSGPQSSMSYYYYYGGPIGGPRDVFVGALWAIGVFLILYTPEGDRKTWWLSENGWLNVAGISACLIALAPMNPSGDCGGNPDWSIHSLHGVFAAVFFIAISKVCWSYPADMTKNEWLTRGSKACAVTMLVTITVAFLYYFLVAPVLGIKWKEYFCGFSAVFWVEFFAVNAFAIYWALKSVDENVGLQRLEAVGASFNEGLRLLPPWFQTVWDWVARRRRSEAGVKAE